MKPRTAHEKPAEDPTAAATGAGAPPLRSRMVRWSPIYYGWLVLVAGSLGLFMTTPGQTVGVSVFLDGILAELGMSRTTASLMYTFATLAASLALPFVGRFIDVRGPRLAVVVIGVLFALACGFMGLVTGPLTLALGFLLIRGLGQGALSLVSLHVINLWFVRRRGLAIGLSGVGFALSFSAFPPLIDALIGQLGWRWAYAALGGLVALTIVPLGWLLFRGHPERFGVAPDGDPPGRAAPHERNLTLRQARRTGAFWLYTMAGFTVAMLGTALLFHNYDILGQQGVSRASATAALGVLGVVAAGAILLSGALLDRLPYRLLLAVELALLALALVLAGFVRDPRAVLLYGVVFGLTNGVAGAISGSVYAHLFGRLHLGAIKGTSQTIGVAGTALGPFLFAFGLDLFGSYRPVLLLTALIPLALLALTPFVGPPRGDAAEAAISETLS